MSTYVERPTYQRATQQRECATPDCHVMLYRVRSTGKIATYCKNCLRLRKAEQNRKQIEAAGVSVPPQRSRNGIPTPAMIDRTICRCGRDYMEVPLQTVCRCPRDRVSG